ncbi:hypothetical protein Peur_065467 [Populus x canadensis]
MYNPHCFAWYHGFKQRLLGTHVFSSYYIDSSSLYHASLSLTRQGSGATFHVLKVNNLISSDIDPSYIAWWDKKMFPQFINIYIRVLSQSENSNFSLNLSEKTRSISRDKEKASTKVVLPPPSFQKHGRPKLQHQSFTKQTWKNSSSLQASIQHKTSSENKGSNPLPPPYSPREVDNSSNKTPIIDLDNIPPQISSHSKHDTGDKDFKLLSPLFSPKEMDSNLPNRLDNIPEVIATLTESSTIPSTLYEGYPNNIDGVFWIQIILPTKLTMTTKKSLLMPTLIFDDVMRSIILAGLSKFLKKQFKHVLLSGLSSLRGWWISKSSKLIENLKYFHVNPSYLMDMMGMF